MDGWMDKSALCSAANSYSAMSFFFFFAFWDEHNDDDDDKKEDENEEKCSELQCSPLIEYSVTIRFFIVISATTRIVYSIDNI